MPIIPLAEVKPGMVLAKPIRRITDGLILLDDNIELNPSCIEKMKSLDIDSVWIRDCPEYNEDNIFGSVRDQIRLRATSLLRTIVSWRKNSQTVDIIKLVEPVKELLENILCNSRLVYTINEINAYDGYTFTHSIDVCVLSMLIGLIMGLNCNELVVLGSSALLHDIGKIFVNPQILNKPDKLTTNEYEKIKTHTREGYEILRTKTNISFLIPHMALQHHEREDGSGYPRGLSAGEVHRFAKIIAVADVFDAMTSKRIYQEPVPASSAIQEICDNTPIKYNQAVVDSFTKIITPYSRRYFIVR